MHHSQGTMESPESTEHARSRIGRTVIAGRTITVGVLQRIFDAAPWRVVILSVVVMAWSLSLLTQQSCGRVVVSVAAGGKDGESYKMLSAVSRLIQRRHPNVTIKVLATKGTEENLRRLNGGGVELATAQADVALDAWLTRSATKDAGSGGLMAVLFVDKVQLLACGLPQKGAPFSAQQAFAALAEQKTKAVVSTYRTKRAGHPAASTERSCIWRNTTGFCPIATLSFATRRERCPDARTVSASISCFGFGRTEMRGFSGRSTVDGDWWRCKTRAPCGSRAGRSSVVRSLRERTG